MHPSDTAPALVALQASVTIAGPNGHRTVPVENFHRPPSEDYTRETVLEPADIVTEIVLPPPADGLRSSYRKVRARRTWDFALAAEAAVKNAEPMEQNEYKIPLFRGLIEQQLMAIA